MTELIHAVIDGDLELCKELIDEGVNVNVNAKNYYGDTALMLALFYGHTEIVKILEQAGAK